MIPIATPVRTQAIVNRYLIHTQKKLGQNFLVDVNVIQAILQAAEIQPGDHVIEIGPGIGALSEQLLLAGAKVLAYEVDPALKPILENELPAKIEGVPLAEKFQLKLQDVLKADLTHDSAAFFQSMAPVKVVANLPYYITTPIIFSLLHSDLPWHSLTLMMQKEVAQRLVAVPKTKAFGPLSIAVQTRMKAQLQLEVDKTSFWPQPKVSSSVVTLTPLKQPLVAAEDTSFDRMVKRCFNQRRKTLLNNLKPILPDAGARKALVKSLDVKPNARPEELSIAQIIALVKALSVKR